MPGGWRAIGTTARRRRRAGRWCVWAWCRHGHHVVVTKHGAGVSNDETARRYMRATEAGAKTGTSPRSLDELTGETEARAERAGERGGVDDGEGVGREGL